MFGRAVTASTTQQCIVGTRASQIHIQRSVKGSHRESLNYLTVNFDLLLVVLVDVTDKVVHLLHELQVAEGQFVRGHAKHVPQGSECAEEQSRWLDVEVWKCVSRSDL